MSSIAQILRFIFAWDVRMLPSLWLLSAESNKTLHSDGWARRDGDGMWMGWDDLGMGIE